VVKFLFRDLLHPLRPLSNETQLFAISNPDTLGDQVNRVGDFVFCAAREPWPIVADADPAPRAYVHSGSNSRAWIA
jgi:hypothetical protein